MNYSQNIQYRYRKKCTLINRVHGSVGAFVQVALTAIGTLHTTSLLACVLMSSYPQIPFRYFDAVGILL